MTKTYSKTRVLIEGAMMIAMATVLSEIKIFSMPYGGDVTAVSMLPLILMSFRHGLKWGMFTAFVNSILQLLLGLNNVAYCPTLLSQIGCIAFDYILAFSVLGLASVFGGKLKNKILGVAVGTAVVCALRFCAAVLSGALIWGGYQSYYEWATGLNVWVYSMIYNGNYMLPETIITIIVAIILVKFMPKLFDK